MELAIPQTTKQNPIVRSIAADSLLIPRIVVPDFVQFTKPKTSAKGRGDTFPAFTGFQGGSIESHRSACLSRKSGKSVK